MDAQGHITESRLTLLICLLASLAAHLLILPGVTFRSDRSARDQSSAAEAAEPFEQAVTRTLTPGIQAKTPARITWIGYEESVEHRVREAEQDQAAMERGGERRAAIGAGPRSSSEAAMDVERTTVVAEALQAAMETGRRQAHFLEQLMQRAGEVAIAQADQPELDLESADALAVSDQARESSESADETESAIAGSPSDRDADPTSVRPPIAEVRLGRPVAREGVEVRTTRPHVSVVTRWSSLHPRVPLMRLDFRSDGTVERVHVLESTGYRQVDQDLVDCLYEWTASGKEIEALDETETLPFYVRIQRS